MISKQGDIYPTYAVGRHRYQDYQVLMCWFVTGGYFVVKPLQAAGQCGYLLKFKRLRYFGAQK